MKQASNDSNSRLLHLPRHYFLCAAARDSDQVIHRHVALKLAGIAKGSAIGAYEVGKSLIQQGSSEYRVAVAQIIPQLAKVELSLWQVQLCYEDIKLSEADGNLSLGLNLAMLILKTRDQVAVHAYHEACDGNKQIQENLEKLRLAF